MTNKKSPSPTLGDGPFLLMTVAEPLVGVAVLLPSGAANPCGCHAVLRWTGQRRLFGCLAWTSTASPFGGSTLDAHQGLCYCHLAEAVL
jgi:hypothetical protein